MALRERIWLLLKEDLPAETIATQLLVGHRTVTRLKKQMETTQSLAPLPRKHGPTSQCTPEIRAWLQEIVQNEPDLFEYEYVERLTAAHGLVIHRSTMGIWLRSLGITRKKKRFELRNRRPLVSKP
jgi:transposase